MSAPLAVAESEFLSDEENSEKEGDSNDEELFEDAVEKQDFETSIKELNLAIQYFFNNEFEESRRILEERANSSMYHALGLSVLDFLDAVFTFESSRIQKASDTLQKCIKLCNQYKHKYATFSDKIKEEYLRGVNYNEYKPEEIHAELCLAEAILLKSFLLLIEDETLINFIKSCIKVKSCYNSYKKCNGILKNYEWNNEFLKTNFESGVKMGIGSFNLLISILPKKVIKLLEFIGFSGDREIGLKELQQGSNLFGTTRQISCILLLLMYNLITVYVVSNNDGDLEMCERLLETHLEKFPKGVLFLIYKGRLEFMKGHIEEAEHWYIQSLKSQNTWPQFHHICYWELMWLNICKGNYTTASHYTEQLLQKSKWSPAMFSYIKACLLIMNNTEKQEIDELMTNVPTLKQRIAGKSIPTEKFAIKRAQLYFQQDHWLCLPAFEILYLYSYFKALSKDIILFQGMFKVIEKELETIKPGEHEIDNKCLLWLLKGACLRYMKTPLQAEACLKQVTSREKILSEDNNYLVPSALVELGLLEMERSNYKEANIYLENAKRNYSGYSLETKLHFRIHSAQTEMVEILKKR